MVSDKTEDYGVEEAYGRARHRNPTNQHMPRGPAVPGTGQGQKESCGRYQVLLPTTSSRLLQWRFAIVYMEKTVI
jgi:hypothetical protein